MKALQLPGDERPGLKRFLRRILDHRRSKYNKRGAGPRAAFALWLEQVAADDYQRMLLAESSLRRSVRRTARRKLRREMRHCDGSRAIRRA